MRSSGILCHFSALPSKDGIGDFGPQSYRWVDALHLAGQQYWQVLPVGHPDDTGCPYATDSAFGISEIYISLEKIISDYKLSLDYFPPSKSDLKSNRVNFKEVKKHKLKMLRKFFKKFRSSDEYQAFQEAEKSWLDPYCIFRTLQQHRGGIWTQWPSYEMSRTLLSEEEQKTFRCHQMIQFLAASQLLELKNYAQSQRVSLIGDVPIFVSYQSMDVWKQPEEFLLNKTTLQLDIETGAAPDVFSESGQKWGTPIYNWDVQKNNQFKWWQQRFSFLKKYFDVLRVDHFRGFCATWVSSTKESNAKNGYWSQGPGIELFKSLKNLPEIIAEDLGVITEDVEMLRDELKYPGMRVLQFMLGDDRNPHKLKNYTENSIAYSGTHDCDTLLGWVRGLSMDEKGFIQAELDISIENQWGFLGKLMNSPSKIVLIQVQDLLGLDSNARFNYPGTVNDKNWTWRLSEDDLLKIPWQQLHSVTEESKRIVCG